MLRYVQRHKYAYFSLVGYVKEQPASSTSLFLKFIEKKIHWSQSIHMLWIRCDLNHGLSFFVDICVTMVTRGETNTLPSVHRTPLVRSESFFEPLSRPIIKKNPFGIPVCPTRWPISSARSMFGDFFYFFFYNFYLFFFRHARYMRRSTLCQVVSFSITTSEIIRTRKP